MTLPYRKFIAGKSVPPTQFEALRAMVLKHPMMLNSEPVVVYECGKVQESFLSDVWRLPVLYAFVASKEFDDSLIRIGQSQAPAQRFSLRVRYNDLTHEDLPEALLMDAHLRVVFFPVNGQLFEPVSLKSLETRLIRLFQPVQNINDNRAIDLKKSAARHQRCLEAVRQVPMCNLSDLSCMLGWPSPTVKSILDDLEYLGLIRRAAIPNSCGGWQWSICAADYESSPPQAA